MDLTLLVFASPTESRKSGNTRLHYTDQCSIGIEILWRHFGHCKNFFKLYCRSPCADNLEVNLNFIDVHSIAACSMLLNDAQIGSYHVGVSQIRSYHPVRAGLFAEPFRSLPW